MLKNLRQKLKDPFVKEVLLAIVLFCLPFLLWVHVLFSDEEFTVLKVLNWEYNHGYEVDRTFVWILLSHVIPISYLVTYFWFGKSRIRFPILGLILVLMYSLVQELLRGFVEMPRENNSNIALFLIIGIVFFFSRLIVKKKNTHHDILSLPFSLREILQSSILVLLVFLFFIQKIESFYEMKSIELGIIRFHSYGFYSIAILFWVLSVKLMVCIPSIMWILEERKWWKYALLNPILITVYQIRNAFLGNSADDIIDEHEIIQALPLLGLVLIILLALSKNAKEQYLFQAIYQKTYARFEQKALAKHQQEEAALAQAKAKLDTLKTNQEITDMDELLELKRQLEEKLSDKN